MSGVWCLDMDGGSTDVFGCHFYWWHGMRFTKVFGLFGLNHPTVANTKDVTIVTQK